ncbi:MAG: RNA methyltransferase [Alphaproteobacteria bacterium]
MRGYFGIGVEGVTKSMNAGGLFRTAHAFGASFVFTIGARYARGEGGLADTSDTPGQIPLYEFADAASLRLPRDCRLVGVEFLEDGVELPTFRHPRAAAYVLGRERGSLSPELMALCDHVVKIPTRLCLNIGIAGAIVMYDRLLSSARFRERPVVPDGPAAALPIHVFGEPVLRRRPGAQARGTSGRQKNSGNHRKRSSRPS